MDHDTVTWTAATVRKRLDTANGPRRNVVRTHRGVGIPGARQADAVGGGRWPANWVPGSSALFRDHAVHNGMGQVPASSVRLAVRAVLWWAKEAGASPKIATTTRRGMGNG